MALFYTDWGKNTPFVLHPRISLVILVYAISTILIRTPGAGYFFMQVWFRRSTDVYGTERQVPSSLQGQHWKTARKTFKFVSPPVLQMHAEGSWRIRTEPAQTWEGHSNSAQPPGLPRQEPPSCEATVLTAAPLCHPIQVNLPVTFSTATETVKRLKSVDSDI